MPRLFIEKGPDKGKSVVVSGKDTVIVGRETTANPRISDSMASRLHFRIELRGDSYYVVDLNSMNGTFVNGERIKDKLLKIGDKIQVGETLISFLGDVAAQKQGPVGQVISGYKVMERVGRGGMGTVYKALQISLSRIVALKLLADELVKDKTFINMFVQEARAAAQLNHPNIVQVYDVGVDKDNYFFSMEFMPGGSLQDILTKRKKLSPELAVNIILQAARGLEYAEKKGIVHRDIKPDNLMVGEEEAIKIGDLGLAKSVRAPFVEEQTSTIFGTPHYVAPEQATGKPVDHRSDIYSLGCTFYRILTGVTPFSGASIKEIIAKKLKDDPVPLKKLEPTLSEELCEIVDRMIKREPDERFQSATELIKSLESIKSGQLPLRSTGAPAAKPAVSKEIGTAPIPKSLGVSVILPIILAVLSLLTGALIVVHYLQNIRPALAREAAVQDALHKEFNKAEQSFIAIKQDDANTLSEVLGLYKILSGKSPTGDLKQRIQARIDELTKRIEHLSYAERREAKSRSDFAVLSDGIKQGRRNLMEQPDVKEIGEFRTKWVGALNDFLRNYNGTSAAAPATELLGNLSMWLERVDAAGRKYSEVESQVKSSLAQYSFANAYNAAEGSADNALYKDTPYETLAHKLLTDVREEASSDFEREVKSKVESLINEEKFPDARDLLVKKQGFYGIKEIEDELTKLLSEVEQEINRRRTADEQHRLDEDRRIFYPQYINALDSAYLKGDFDGAKALLTGLKLQTPEYKARLEDALYEIACEPAIIAVLTDKNNVKQLTKKEGVSFRKQHIENITDKGIILVNGQTVYWEELTVREFYELMSSIEGNLNPLQKLKLGVFCLRRGGLEKEAGRMFGKVAAGTLPLEERNALNKYQDLKTMLRLRVEDAGFILVQANAYYAEQQYYPALKAFNLLKQCFDNTPAYTDNRADIEQKITDINNYIKKNGDK